MIFPDCCKDDLNSPSPVASGATKRANPPTAATASITCNDTTPPGGFPVEGQCPNLILWMLALNIFTCLITELQTQLVNMYNVHCTSCQIDTSFVDKSIENRYCSCISLGISGSITLNVVLTYHLTVSDDTQVLLLSPPLIRKIARQIWTFAYFQIKDGL